MFDRKMLTLDRFLVPLQKLIPVPGKTAPKECIASSITVTSLEEERLILSKLTKAVSIIVHDALPRRMHPTVRDPVNSYILVHGPKNRPLHYIKCSS